MTESAIKYLHKLIWVLDQADLDDKQTGIFAGSRTVKHQRNILSNIVNTCIWECRSLTLLCLASLLKSVPDLWQLRLFIKFISNTEFVLVMVAGTRTTGISCIIRFSAVAISGRVGGVSLLVVSSQFWAGIISFSFIIRVKHGGRID